MHFILRSVRLLSLTTVAAALAVSAHAVPEGGIPSSALIQPADLAQLIQSNKADKPLLIQVGYHVLYAQAHISGSEYIGPATSDAAIAKLRKRLNPLPKNKLIVIYCGCCPWSHCPNLQPAYDALKAMGFTNLKVLYIADNLGTDWVDKGYPVEKGD